MRAAEFFAFARARHAITLDRAAGAPEPWTDDPILGTYRFTNIFRELDRTTVWFRENVRDLMVHSNMSECQQVLGTILFRTLNRIASGEVLFNQGQLPINGSSDPIGWSYLCGNATIEDVEGVLRNAIPSGPWVTGAYIVKTPDGMDKLRGALWIVEEARRRVGATLAELTRVEGPPASLERLQRLLERYPYMGPFTAYEVVSDLRWLPILQDAPDIMTWANAGPGATRGLNWIHGRPWNQSVKQTQLCQEMRELLELSKDPANWPQGDPDWPAWEMREVEHWCCETLKYMRYKSGGSAPRGVFRR